VRLILIAILNMLYCGITDVSRHNPMVKYIPYETQLVPEICVDLFQQYDLILDCTDNPASRYLISDACVITGKRLISASALRTEGQLMVLNNPPQPPGDAAGGPCYRCIFPKPPPADSVVTCGEGGILGSVVGVMGVLQALEAIKLITLKPSTESDPETSPAPADALTADSASKSVADPPSMLLFSAYSKPPFRSIRLRPRRPKCAACSADATVDAGTLTSGSLDYVQFCGIANPVDILPPEDRISAQDYNNLANRAKMSENQGQVLEPNHILIDVREKVQYNLCKLDNSVNIPFSHITSATHNRNSNQKDAVPPWASKLLDTQKPIFVVCRLGNDSQLAVQRMKDLQLDSGGKRRIQDIEGGMRAWRQKVDPQFPDY
jgi:adenylyltransferase and sulfurtransferase